MQLNYVHMQHIYVNMRDNYVSMRDNYVNYVRFQHNYACSMLAADMQLSGLKKSGQGSTYPDFLRRESYISAASNMLTLDTPDTVRGGGGYLGWRTRPSRHCQGGGGGGEGEVTFAGVDHYIFYKYILLASTADRDNFYYNSCHDPQRPRILSQGEAVYDHIYVKKLKTRVYRNDVLSIYGIYLTLSFKAA